MFVSRSCVLAFGISAILFASFVPSAKGAAMQSLGRSLQKLEKQKKLKIAYFSGPTVAQSPGSASWKSETSAWFQSRNPQGKVTEVIAADEGGSEYGAFRFRKDIMEKDPDLLFVEFAVDDADVDEERVMRSIEGIVRQYWTSNPWAEIVFVYTTSKNLAASYEGGEVPKAVGYHQAVAKHYGIPEIHVGRTMVDAIKSGGGTWESLTTDGVHPNEAGTAIYFRAIKAFLDAHVSDRVEEAVLALPDHLSKDPFGGAYVAKTANMYAPGWRKVTTPAESVAPHIEADAPGTDLVHTFTGSTVGLLLLVGADGGDIEWSIDDGPLHRLTAWQRRSDAGLRQKFIILADDLKGSGEHKLLIRVHAEKQPESKGNRIRIAAFMMHCDC